MTPQRRRARRASATSTPLRLAHRPSGENALVNDEHPESDSEDGRDSLLLRPTPKRPRRTAFRASLAPPKLRSFVSAPTIPATIPPTVCHDSNLPRPDIRQRSASDQTPLRRTAAEIDRSIAELIAKGQEAKSDKKGYVYVFEASRNDGSPVLYKVGKSVTPLQRIKDIRRKCKFAELTEEVYSVSRRPLKKFAVAEKLIQEELACFRYDMRCPCGQRHGEYFQVEDKRVVLEAFQRWHTFCRDNPWGADGRLSGRWKFRLDNRPSLRGDGDHHALTGVWQQFVTPTSVRGTIWAALYTVGQISPYWWQTVAFVQAMAMAPLSSMSTWAWLWALFIAFCFLLERLEIGYPWLEKCLLALLDMVDTGTGDRKVASYVGFRTRQNEVTMIGGELATETNDHPRPVKTRSNAWSPSAYDESAQIEPPGAWNTEEEVIDEQATGIDESAQLEGMDNYMEDGTPEDIGVDGGSPRSECSDVSLLGRSRESPIVIE